TRPHVTSSRSTGVQTDRANRHGSKPRLLPGRSATHGVAEGQSKAAALPGRAATRGVAEVNRSARAPADGVPGAGGGAGPPAGAAGAPGGGRGETAVGADVRTAPPGGEARTHGPPGPRGRAPPSTGALPPACRRAS